MLGNNIGREFNCWEITHVKNSAKHLPHTVWSLGARFSPYVISEELVFLVKKTNREENHHTFFFTLFFLILLFFLSFFFKPCLFLKLLSQLSQTRFSVPAVCCSLRSWQTLTRPPGPLTGTSTPILGAQQNSRASQIPSIHHLSYQPLSSSQRPCSLWTWSVPPPKPHQQSQDLGWAPSPLAQQQALPSDCPLFGSGPLFFFLI